MISILIRCPNLGWLLRRSSSTPSFQLMSKLCTLTGKRGTGNRDIISARRKMKMPSLTWHAQNIYCSICILRHCSFPDLSLGLAGWKSCDCGWTCDQLTSNTHTAVLFIHYSTALENSIIKIHLADWNALFPEAFEPRQSRSEQQTRGSFSTQT